jgi:hypothetical protein
VHDQSSLNDLVGHWGPGGASVLIVSYADVGPRATRAGTVRPNSDIPALARFGPYTLTNAVADACNGMVAVALTWQTETALLPPTGSLFVQALDPDGRITGQADGPPLALRPDLGLLRPGWEAEDVRVFPAPGADRLLVGAYDYVTGDRYPAVSLGINLPEDALDIPVQRCPDGG